MSHHFWNISENSWSKGHNRKNHTRYGSKPHFID